MFKSVFRKGSGLHLLVLCLFLLNIGYGLGKKFTQHHELIAQATAPQDSAEEEVGEELKHLVRVVNR